jgi:hypothetical protein
VIILRSADSHVVAAAIQWGNFPQWVSAVASFLLLLGAAWLLLHSGRRLNLQVRATALEAPGGRTVLDVRTVVTPVGSWRVEPFQPVPCECTSQLHLEPEHELRYHSWEMAGRCKKAIPWDQLEPKHLRFPTIFKDGEAMKARRRKWGCLNRRVPRLEVYEVLAEYEAGTFKRSERLVAFVLNPLEGVFAEPRETVTGTSVVPVQSPADAVIGWRVVARLWVAKEWWFFQPPFEDSWEWSDHDFVVRADRVHSG